MRTLNKLIETPFYYVRHGQTDWNAEGRAMGQADIPLNSRGIKQATQARHALAAAGITTICHSPLSRAKQTAELFNEVLHCELVEIEELREFHLGSYSGKIIGQWFQDWQEGALLDGAESYASFLERCIRGINKALSFPGMVLIVAHGGVYWAVEHAIHVSLEHDLPNCIPAFHLPPKHGKERWEIVFK